MGSEEEGGIGVFGSETDDYCVEDVGEGEGEICEEGCRELPSSEREDDWLNDTVWDIQVCEKECWELPFTERKDEWLNDGTKSLGTFRGCWSLELRLDLGGIFEVYFPTRRRQCPCPPCM